MISPRVILCAAVSAAVTLALLEPTVALAHAEGAVRYKFPLPTWIYAIGGTLAVALSVPAALHVAPSGHDPLSRDIYPRIRSLRLGSIAIAIGFAVIPIVAAGGLFGTGLFTANPATIIIWVDIWVGVGITSAILGNVWDVANPLSFSLRSLDALLTRRGQPAFDYPPQLGMWPAVVLLLVWTWLEVCWAEASEPQLIVRIAAGYVVLQIAGVSLFGAEVWLRRGELLTATATVFGRFAPLEFAVAQPHGQCPARSCPSDDAERIGCTACWLAAPKPSRRVRFRRYGAGIRRETGLPRGGSAFVVGLLATVVADGFTRTTSAATLNTWITDQFPALIGHTTTLATLSASIVIAGFVSLYLIASWTMARLDHRTVAATIRLYTPTMIPIAAVYFVAHYATYLFIFVQFTPGVLADPFEHEWVPDTSVYMTLPSAAVWWSQILLIVLGHVIAVFLASHRDQATSHSTRPHARLAGHLPITLLMIAFTGAGLWVLAQSIKA